MKSDAMIVTYFKELEKYKKKYDSKVILFWQCGSFFEIYGLYNKNHEEAAHTTLSKAQEICGLTVSTKSANFENYKIKMAGVPLSADLNKYIKKLIDHGYTVPVWIQDPQMKTHRYEAYISTPGTLFCDDQDTLSNNIMCIWINIIKNNKIFKQSRIAFGISIIDCFTAEVRIFQYISNLTHDSCTFDCLERLCSIYNPNEILIIHNYNEKGKIDDIIKYISSDATKINFFDMNDADAFYYEKLKNVQRQNYQENILKKYYKVNNINAFIASLQLLEKCFMTNSLCFLLDYVCNLNKSLIKNLKIPISEKINEKLLLANHSLKQLNIIDDQRMKNQFSSILNMLNKCISRIGKRQFTKMLLNPVTNNSFLNNNYDMISYILNNYDSFILIRKTFTSIKDIEIYNRKISFTKLTPRELAFLHKTLQTVNETLNTPINQKTFITDEKIKNYFQFHNIDLFLIQKNINEIMDFIENTIDLDVAFTQDNIQMDTNIFKAGVFPAIDKLTIEKYENNDIIQSIIQHLSQYVKKRDITKNVINIIKPRENPMYLECTQLRKEMISLGLKKAESTKILNYTSSFDKITKTFVFNNQLTFINKAGKASKTKIESTQLNNLYIQIYNHQKVLSSTLTATFKDYLNSFQKYNDNINGICELIGLLDTVITNAYNATNFNYCKPIIDNEHANSYFKADQLRHPIIEHIQNKITYIPNDISIGKDKKGILLYGTNSVGKSSLIRSIGMAIVMAQAGMFVSASKFTYKPYTSIYTRIIGNDNLFKGLSTFGVEMTELNNILRNCDENSLILGDELCSGTESSSAISIFVAGLQHFSSSESSHIFATHFHEILKMKEIRELKGLSINHMAVKYDRNSDLLVYCRTLREGSGNKTYGLEVCESLHLPPNFMDKCYAIRNNIDKGEVLNNKNSRYNSNKLKGICEKCGKVPAEEVHHLIPQQYMRDGFYLNIAKNHEGNLLSVCKKCHEKFTKEDKKHIKVETTKGTQLLEI
jgi:DNA mismatch repair protein MutS